MATKLREVPGYERGRLYWIGTGGRVMSRPGGRGGKHREEDMSPIVRKPKHMYYVKDGHVWEAPMGKK